MNKSLVGEAIAWAEKANANLEPNLMTSEDRRRLRAEYARLKKLAAYGETALSSELDDPEELARLSGTSVGKAKATVEAAKKLQEAAAVQDAFAGGDISLDQATEIAKAEVACPGSAEKLLKTAVTESFQVLREKSRKVVLEAEQKLGLAERQKKARAARTHSDELGMTDIHLRLEPHIGTPIVNRAEAEAARLYKAAKEDGKQEPFERHLADAYAKIFSGSSVQPHSSRPELVILVSHEVTKRGWTEVRDGEVCKIPGVGPVPPAVAREIGRDAFLNGVVYDGNDLRHFKRWTKHIPIEVRMALCLGDPPEFDGPACIDCGKRFRTQWDHFDPRNNGGPTCTDNVGPRCVPCHTEKTRRDRAAGKLTPRRPEGNKPLRR
ncbi:MAG: HNH endonuclease [Actinomycetota bacterium]